jgi:hypothetical protein
VVAEIADSVKKLHFDKPQKQIQKRQHYQSSIKYKLIQLNSFIFEAALFIAHKLEHHSKLRKQRLIDSGINHPYLVYSLTYDTSGFNQYFFWFQFK